VSGHGGLYSSLKKRRRDRQDRRANSVEAQTVNKPYRCTILGHFWPFLVQLDSLDHIDMQKGCRLLLDSSLEMAISEIALSPVQLIYFDSSDQFESGTLRLSSI
jgi:hypothetical protein